MSHFTSIKTQLENREYLIQALQGLGYVPQQGKLTIKGFLDAKTKVEIKIRLPNSDHEVGFRKEGSQYVCVADWYGVHQVDPEQFLQQISQGYAYLAVKDTLATQGFSIANEQRADERIHIVLRRLV
jgi:hypothetical protein